jgi:hypothetical protein
LRFSLLTSRRVALRQVKRVAPSCCVGLHLTLAEVVGTWLGTGFPGLSCEVFPKSNVIRRYRVGLQAGSCAGASLTISNVPYMRSDLRLRPRPFSSVLSRSQRHVPEMCPAAGAT